MTEKLYTDMISCSTSDKILLMNECKNLFLKYHPELKGMRITQGFMLKKVIEFYLEG